LPKAKMRYQLIMPHYNGTNVEFVARNEMGHKTVVEAPHINSYMYVKADQMIKKDSAITYVDRDYPYIGLNGEKLWRIETKQPTDVRRLRYWFRKTWESDVPFVRRVMIDLGITGAFDDDLKPVEGWNLPPVICTIDIETLTVTKKSWKADKKAGRLVVAMIAFKFTSLSGEEVNIQFILDSELTERYKCKRTTENGEEILEIHFNQEADLLRYFWILMKKKWPDVVTGWNVKFDTGYPLLRSWRLARKYPFLREYVGEEDDWSGSQEDKFQKFWENRLKILRFDLLRSYDELYKPVSKKLKRVAKDEGISDREHETGGIFHRLYWEDREEAARYNYDDVWDTWQINLKHRVIEFFWENKNFAGMETLEKSVKAGNLLDTIMLRLANNNVILPTHEEVPKKEPFEGAVVFEPELGVYHNVATLDASRYYPSIILAFPEKFYPIIVKMVKYVSKGRDIVEKLLEKLLPGTDEYYSVFKRMESRKFLLNAVYGTLGDRKFRLFNKIMAGTITRLCRAGIRAVAKMCQQYGLFVVYGDTDSVFVSLQLGARNPETNALINKGMKYVGIINEFLQKFFHEAENPELIYFKMEKLWQPIVLTGRKKQYFGRVIWQDGKFVDRIVVRGLRSRRRDSSVLTNEIMAKVYRYICNGFVNRVVPYVRGKIQKFRTYSLEDIMIGRGVNKPLHKYKVNAVHKRGSVYANHYIYCTDQIKEGSRVFILYCKVKHPTEEYPQTDVICVEDADEIPEKIFKVDNALMIEKTIQKPLEGVFEAVGLRWDEVKPQKDVKKLFRRVPKGIIRKEDIIAVKEEEDKITIELK